MRLLFGLLPGGDGHNLALPFIQEHKDESRGSSRSAQEAIIQQTITIWVKGKRRWEDRGWGELTVELLFWFVLSNCTWGRLFLQFNLKKYLSTVCLTWMKKCREGSGFPSTHRDSPSGGEYGNISNKCGDNGVQTQSISQRKKIATREKIKGNALTLVYLLNQPFPPVRLAPFLLSFPRAGRK